MEKLPMCRICLAENVRMYVVVNKNLHELYERLTDTPFVTDDSRPILACSFCCAKLKQCFRLLRQCLEAEELFAQIMNGNYEPKPLINQDHLKVPDGFIICPTVSISISEVGLTESVVKEELPAVCESQDDIIEPKEEYQSDGSTVADEPKLHVRRTKLEDSIPADQQTNQIPDSEIIRNTQNRTSKYICKFKKPHECEICHCKFSTKSNLKRHVRTHLGEKPYKCDICQRSFSQKGNLASHFRTHTGEKPYKCDICQRSFDQKFKLTSETSSPRDYSRLDRAVTRGPNSGASALACGNKKPT